MLNKLPGMSRAAAARYVDSGSRRAAKLANRVETKMPRDTNAIRYSREFADAHRNATIAARQRQVGRRYVAFGAGSSASFAMRPNPNQQQTGYRRPMTSAPPGSGRFA